MIVYYTQLRKKSRSKSHILLMSYLARSCERRPSTIASILGLTKRAVNKAFAVLRDRGLMDDANRLTFDPAPYMKAPFIVLREEELQSMSLSEAILISYRHSRKGLATLPVQRVLSETTLSRRAYFYAMKSENVLRGRSDVTINEAIQKTKERTKKKAERDDDVGIKAFFLCSCEEAGYPNAPEPFKEQIIRARNSTKEYLKFHPDLTFKSMIKYMIDHWRTLPMPQGKARPDNPTMHLFPYVVQEIQQKISLKRPEIVFVDVAKRDAGHVRMSQTEPIMSEKELFDSYYDEMLG